ncbi:hypothetical protein [Paraburkholderia sp. BCC1886]|uniref:hypothetical protein n=1 Tax=Paraburkholderia sp. BCC1886 TaxID=2562670 RepID=UPI0011821873|nr:hypothetical protein [Paraburkholderia sp. BCC1886]
MNNNISASTRDLDAGGRSGEKGHPDAATIFRVGAQAGLTGAIVIWIYEAVVWVGVQHLMPMGGIPRNATGLVFGKAFQESIGIWAYVLGTVIHFTFAIAWGVAFAAIWPSLRKRGYEATLVALFYAILAWIVMHVAISISSSNHPNYFDPNVIIGGFMSHFCFTIPLALVVKKKLAAYSPR